MAKQSTQSTAIDQILSLIDKSPKEKTPIEAAPDAEDVVISQAVRNKNVATLGLDPTFSMVARKSAKLNQVLKEAGEKFAEVQNELREYGIKKREEFNRVFRCSVTSVNIPYVEEAEEGGQGNKGHIQIVCSNKYSVAQDTVLALEPEMGDDFQLLFEKKEEKVLREDAEPLFREILLNLGLPEDKIEASMEALLETRTTVTTTEKYESLVETVDPDSKAILSRSVIRQKPGIRFL